MNSLISHGQARKKSLLPALTQKAKFVNFCYEIEIIKQELLMLFHDEQNNEIDHSNTDDKIEKIIREIVNTFLKKSTIYTKSRYSNNVNFIGNNIYLPDNIQENIIKGMNKTNYCQSSFQDIVLLLNTLKAHFWCNEKKNKSVYDVLFYNRNLEIFLYPIEIIDINQFMEHLKANYDYLLKPYLQNSYKFEINLDDLDEYPYEIKVLYESETKKNNQKLKVVKLNGNHYFYFDEITKEILDLFLVIQEIHILDIEAEKYRDKVLKILDKMGGNIANINELYKLNQNFNYIDIDFHDETIDLKCVERDIKRIGDGELIIGKLYFNISSARFEKIEKSGVDKEIIKYLKNCQEYFNDFYTQSTDNVINFSAVYSIFTAILNKNGITLIGNYKEYIKIITLLFSLDNYVSNSRIYNENNFLSLLLEKKPFEYEKIKELYFKDIEGEDFENLEKDDFYNEFIGIDEDCIFQKELNNTISFIKNGEFDKFDSLSFYNYFNSQEKINQFLDNFQSFRDKIYLINYITITFDENTFIDNFLKLINLKGFELKGISDLLKNKDKIDNRLLNVIGDIYDSGIDKYDFNQLDIEDLYNISDMIDVRYFMVNKLSSYILIGYNFVDFQNISAKLIINLGRYLKNNELVKYNDCKIIFTNKNKIEFDYDEIKKVFINIEDLKDFENSFVYIDDNKIEIDYINTNIFRNVVKKIFK